MAEAYVYTDNSFADILQQACANADIREDDCYFFPSDRKDDRLIPLTDKEMAQHEVVITINDPELQLQQQQQQGINYQYSNYQQQPVYRYNILYHQESSQVHQGQYQEQCQRNFSSDNYKGAEIQHSDINHNKTDYSQQIPSNVVIEVRNAEQQNIFNPAINFTQELQQNKENEDLQSMQSNIAIEVHSAEQNQGKNISYSLNSQCNNIKTPVLINKVVKKNTLVVGQTILKKNFNGLRQPLPPLYTPVKNVKVVSNALTSAQTSQNSVLCNNMTTNSGSPQVINAVSIGGQLLTTNVPLPVFAKTVTATPTNMILKNPIQQTPQSTTVKTSILTNRNSKQTAGVTTPNNQIRNNIPLIVRTTPVIKNNRSISILKPIGQGVIKPTGVLNSNEPLTTSRIKQNVNSKLQFMKTKILPLIVSDKQEAGISQKSVETPEKGGVVNLQNQRVLIMKPTKNIVQYSQAKIIRNQPNHIHLIQQKDKTYTLFKIVDNNNEQNVNNSNTLPKKAKRGRPKKTVVMPTFTYKKEQQQQQQQQQQLLEDQLILSRTRSGRVSRPPKHIIEDYKHLNRDLTKSDMDDSNCGYIDYNCNGSGMKHEELDENLTSELLTGLVAPKRKVSDQFKCTKCMKTYLGRIKMAKHLQMNPDHGSADQFLPNIEHELQDPAKRRGKKRGLNGCSLDQKSKRQCTMLRDSINACTETEVAGEKVTSSMSVFEFLIKKSGNNVRSFLMELKELGESLRQKATTMLTVANNNDKHNDDVINLNTEVLCDILALNSGFYKINEPLCDERKNEDYQERKHTETSEVDSNELLSQALPQMEIEHHPKKETVERAFIKLEPKHDGSFMKLENGTIRSFQQDNGELGRIQNTFQCVSNGTTCDFNETNGFKKLEPKIMTPSALQTPCGDNIMDDRSSQNHGQNIVEITTNGNGSGNNRKTNTVIDSDSESYYDDKNLLNNTSNNNNLMYNEIDSAGIEIEIGSEKLAMRLFDELCYGYSAMGQYKF